MEWVNFMEKLHFINVACFTIVNAHVPLRIVIPETKLFWIAKMISILCPVLKFSLCFVSITPCIGWIDSG